MHFEGGKCVMVSLLVEESEFDDDQGLRPTIASCMVASIARKRKLEIREKEHHARGITWSGLRQAPGSNFVD